MKSTIGVYEEGKNYNRQVNGFGTGLAPPNDEVWADIAENAHVVDSVSTGLANPQAADNSATQWFPPIGNQAWEGSCVAWSVGYYTKTYQEAKEHNWNLTGAVWQGTYGGHPTASYQDKIISPQFVYHLINYGDANRGTTFPGGLNLINYVGACSWQKMPYDPDDGTTWPSEAAWAEAPQYRGNSTFGYNYISSYTDDGINTLKSWLAAGNLAGIEVDSSEFSNLTAQDIWTTDNYVSTNIDHANTIVGYNDTITYMENGTLHSGAFKVANSWGTGGWEKISDGFYYISYGCMKRFNSCCVGVDLNNYQPELLTTFRINHSIRGDCDILFGYGTPSSTVAYKSFDLYIRYLNYGTAAPFCLNNIVFDITELKSYMSSQYNQPFYMSVYDSSSNTAVGTVSFFAVGSVSCLQTPMSTINGGSIYLNLTYTERPLLASTVTSGPPGASVTFTGAGYPTGSTINLRYLNPLTASWTAAANNLATADGNFTYATTIPDLLQGNPAGDSSSVTQNLIFSAVPTSGPASNNVTYQEKCRGLTQVGNSVATGLYGNNSDLTASIFVKGGDSLAMVGKWFRPGTATLFWDTTSLGTTSINGTGYFNANAVVPAGAVVGRHTLTVRDAATDFCINITRAPTITHDYVDAWHTSDFTVTLTPENGGTQIYYKINNGATSSVSSNGQPTITSQTASNTIEYWGISNLYGTGNIEFPHTTITNIKLDKTAPTGSINSNSQTSSSSVTLTLSATDAVSGVWMMHFSNDGATWSDWEQYGTAKSWTLTSGDGQKTVYVQYIDNAGLTSQYSYAITLQTPSTPTPTVSTPTPTSSPTPTANPPIPELNLQIVLVLLAVSTLMLTLVVKKLKK